MLKNYIVTKHGQHDDLAVYADDYARVYAPPPRINAYFPDVYAKRVLHDEVIIGEAKTGKDVSSNRSMRQIAAFFEYLSVIGNSYFYLAVPWLAKPKAARLIREMSLLYEGVRAQFIVYKGGY